MIFLFNISFSHRTTVPLLSIPALTSRHEIILALFQIDISDSFCANIFVKKTFLIETTIKTIYVAENEVTHEREQNLQF